MKYTLITATVLVTLTTQCFAQAADAPPAISKADLLGALQTVQQSNGAISSKECTLPNLDLDAFILKVNSASDPIDLTQYTDQEQRCINKTMKGLDKAAGILAILGALLQPTPAPNADPQNQPLP
jgi:hypothetical protein